MVNRLTVAEINDKTEPGRYGDGDTLYLNVAPGGSKSWIQRIRVNGRRCDIGLGGYPLVSLAEAREKAFENRKLARAGGDPLAVKHKAAVPTFREAAEQTFKGLRPRWRSEDHARKWWRGMEMYAFPILGDMRVDQIGREQMLSLFTPIWTSQPEQARKLRRWVRATLRWAQAHGYVEGNVAGVVIDGALPTQPAVKEHYRALPYREVPKALATVEASQAPLVARLCLRFTVLTASRSGESRTALWSEIDFDAREWRIPANRMKAGAEHRVPLADAALAVLEQVRPLRDDPDLIFSSTMRPDRILSSTALYKILRITKLSDRTTVHGFRSSFRDWCADTGQPRELAEAALAHVVGGVEGAYFRSDLFERRRILMERWAEYATGTSAPAGHRTDREN